MSNQADDARQIHRILVRRSADLQALHRLVGRRDAPVSVVVDRAEDVRRDLDAAARELRSTVRDALGDAGLAFAEAPGDVDGVATQGRRMADLIGAEHRRAQEALGEVVDLMGDLAGAFSTDPGVLEDARASLPAAIGRMEQASRSAWRISQDLPLLDRAGSSVETARGVDASVPQARTSAPAAASRGTREELRRLPTPGVARSASVAR